ncbi:hypothetical protein DUT90_07345 [Polaribacter sp. WD7]|uniref:hypothetical protein n=1 Tax=Polaribacter sp. WD7 TaxID=2269061 RepID=UPI000DF227CA|nr:hypothetical protein [Polaribacter sp. WD7]RCS26923.1 hypothetical protein DUT90_07345 [Polaribacter sp. WD7]
MAKNTQRDSAENVTKGNAEDKQDWNLHPLKGTVKEGYKDNDANKNRMNGVDKEELQKQVHSATDNSNKKIADKIQNEEK